MDYDIEADWQLLNTCNYRCSYCFFPDAVLGEKLRPAATPAQWERALADTGLTWLLHLTGGEPSLYPALDDLCARLAERHYLSLNSNLTGPGIPGFARRVCPSRVSFVNAGLHAAERERRRGLPVFLRHAALLLAQGFTLFASVVATPGVLADVDGVIATLRPVGLVPFPKMLQGPADGREFPGGYTAEERRRFREFAERARAANRDMLLARQEPWTVDPSGDDATLDGVPSFRGGICQAGERFVSMDGDGRVFRCGTHTPLGNVLDGTFARRPASRCHTSYCHYFCRKYAAPPTALGRVTTLPHTARRLGGRVLARLSP